MASQDVADRIVDEITAWIETRSRQVADAILESAYRPRVVEPTTAEATAYYRSILITPDGYVSEQGKQQLIQQVGATGYEAIARQVARSLRTERDEAFAAARDEATAALEEVA